MTYLALGSLNTAIGRSWLVEEFVASYEEGVFLV